MIYDRTAECEYDYKNGSVGALAIIFCENDRIEVRLNGNEEQSYLLRPYNVSDEMFLGEPVTIEVELDSWGKVTLLCALITCLWRFSQTAEYPPSRKKSFGGFRERRFPCMLHILY